MKQMIGLPVGIDVDKRTNMMNLRSFSHFRIRESAVDQMRLDSVRDRLSPWIIRGRRYPKPLPRELERYYIYLIDSGHCILVVVNHKPGNDPYDELCPAPVKTVQRGYTVKDGLIYCQIPYSSELGLMAPPEDDEY